MITRFVEEMVAKKRYKILVKFLQTASKIKNAEYESKCLQQFRSRAICITKTMPFYIWQKVEAQRLWKQIVG